VEELHGLTEGKTVEVGGIISRIKKIITKTGEPMLFVAIEDFSASVEALVFPSILKEDPILWQEGSLIHLTGRLSFKDGKGNFTEPKIIVNKAKKLEAKPRLFSSNESSGASPSHLLPVLHLKIKKGSDHGILKQIKTIMEEYSGKSAVILHLPEGDGYKPIKITTAIRINDTLIIELKKILGEDSVRVKEPAPV
jgi:DNA polymerase-3 subunit alpha